MARSFASGGWIDLELGTFREFQEATFGMIIKRASQGTSAIVPFCFGSGEGGETYYPYFDNGAAGELGFFNGAVVATELAGFVPTSDNWLALFIDKVGGAAGAIRAHKYVYDTDTWTHTSMGTLNDSIDPLNVFDVGYCIGAQRVTGGHVGPVDCSIEIVGCVDARFANDAAVEAAGLETSYGAWLDFFTGDVAGLWPLPEDQETIIVDVTGNGADQMGTGGVVSNVAGPPQFSYALGNEYVRVDGDWVLATPQVRVDDAWV